MTSMILSYNMVLYYYNYVCIGSMTTICILSQRKTIWKVMTHRDGENRLLSPNFPQALFGALSNQPRLHSVVQERSIFSSHSTEELLSGNLFFKCLPKMTSIKMKKTSELSSSSRFLPIFLNYEYLPTKFLLIKYYLHIFPSKKYRNSSAADENLEL